MTQHHRAVGGEVFVTVDTRDEWVMILGETEDSAVTLKLSRLEPLIEALTEIKNQITR